MNTSATRLLGVVLAAAVCAASAGAAVDSTLVCSVLASIDNANKCQCIQATPGLKMVTRDARGGSSTAGATYQASATSAAGGAAPMTSTIGVTIGCNRVTMPDIMKSLRAISFAARAATTDDSDQLRARATNNSAQQPPDNANAPPLTAIDGVQQPATADDSDQQQPSLPPVDALWLWDNAVPWLPASFFGNVTARSLTLESSGLGAISPDALATLGASLEELDLRHNDLSSVDGPTFAGLRRLARLDLSGNRLSRVAPGCFAALGALRDLSMRRNSIGPTLTGVAIEGSIENQTAAFPIFDGLQRLISLDLNDNKLERIEHFDFQGLDALETLLLAKNQLTFVHPRALLSLRALSHLDLSGNALVKLEISTLRGSSTPALLPTSPPLSELRKVYLNSNRIRSLRDISIGTLCGAPAADSGSAGDDGEGYGENNNTNNVNDNNDIANSGSIISHLHTLHLDANRLVSIPDGVFRRCARLVTLSLTHNHIKQLGPRSFAGLAELQTLSLQNNSISSLPQGTFASTPSLVRLFLSHNGLKEIDPGAFDPDGEAQSQLVTLNLGHNAIADVPQRLFAKMGKLERLYLNDNKMGSLDNSTVAGLEQSVRVLDLSDNHWRCKCENNWFRRWAALQLQRRHQQQPQQQQQQQPSASSAKLSDAPNRPRHVPMTLLHVGRTRCRTGQLLVDLNDTNSDAELNARCATSGNNGPSSVSPLGSHTEDYITVLAVILGASSMLILAGLAVLLLRSLYGTDGAKSMTGDPVHPGDKTAGSQRMPAPAIQPTLRPTDCGPLSPGPKKSVTIKAQPDMIKLIPNVALERESS